MRKITFIGAGSLGFTRALVRDILTFPALEDSIITLMDINSEHLEFIKKSSGKNCGSRKLPCKSNCNHGQS